MSKLLELLQTCSDYTHEHDPEVIGELKAELRKWMKAIYRPVTNPKFLPEVERPFYLIDEEVISELVDILREWVKDE